MSDLIQDWKNRKEKKHKQQAKFARQLKRQKAKKIDETAEKLHQKVFSKIDCLQCANCCTSIPPIVTRSDSNRIAKYLGLKTKDFETQYLVKDEDGDVVMNASPCPFLEKNNACAIYEQRPRACREYPHTNYFMFSQNLHLHATNARYCPAVFHILEAMMRA